MIALLRVGSFAINVVVFFGVPYLCGLSWSVSAVVAVALFALSWWGCGARPRARAASESVTRDAQEAARLMGARAPAFVAEVPGWTAAAVRAGAASYGLLVGEEVAPEDRVAILAHEIAHATTGDLLWEPFTDGPARLLHAAARRVPPLWVTVFPFLMLGAPLARATELRADALAARAVSDYSAVLRRIPSSIARTSTLLYPPLPQRIRHSARYS